MGKNITVDKLTIGNKLTTAIVDTKDILIPDESAESGKISVKDALKRLPSTWVKTVNHIGADDSGNIQLNEDVTEFEVYITDKIIPEGAEGHAYGVGYTSNFQGLSFETDTALEVSNIKIDWGDGTPLVNLKDCEKITPVLMENGLIDPDNEANDGVVDYFIMNPENGDSAWGGCGNIRKYAIHLIHHYYYTEDEKDTEYGKHYTVKVYGDYGRIFMNWSAGDGSISSKRAGHLPYPFHESEDKTQTIRGNNASNLIKLNSSVTDLPNMLAYSYKLKHFTWPKNPISAVFYGLNVCINLTEIVPERSGCTLKYCTNCNTLYNMSISLQGSIMNYVPSEFMELQNLKVEKIDITYLFGNPLVCPLFNITVSDEDAEQLAKIFWNNPNASKFYWDDGQPPFAGLNDEARAKIPVAWGGTKE